jgi:hypothetical protein
LLGKGEKGFFILIFESISIKKINIKSCVKDRGSSAAAAEQHFSKKPKRERIKKKCIGEERLLHNLHRVSKFGSLFLQTSTFIESHRFGLTAYIQGPELSCINLE